MTAAHSARDPAKWHWRNRAGEIVDVEPEFVYPLIKGTDLTRSLGGRRERAVSVTQERIGQDTAPLAQRAPRLWRYLEAHAAWFSKRKSSIYRGQPGYALFGIGQYSFAPFKVAISGLHKTPIFRALGPVAGRPVMLDDTCYFLPCSTAPAAAVVTAICNDPIAHGLLAAMRFRDAKRPITKAILERLDFGAILEHADRQSLLRRARDVLDNELAVPATECLEQVVQRMEREF
jgi:hypothetical protein